MMRASFVPGRRHAVCPACATRYASNDGWAWACYTCGPEQQAQALLAVVEAIAEATDPNRWPACCPYDGCLIRSGEDCPACEVRKQDKRWRLVNYTDTEDDPKRPVAWRPNGRGIQVPVYDQSEVA